MEDGIVMITCYHRTEVTTRSAAIRKYTDGVIACEGAERDRYANILSALLAGERCVNAD